MHFTLLEALRALRVRVHDLQMWGRLRSQHKRLPVRLYANNRLLAGLFIQIGQGNVHIGQVLLVVQDLGLRGFFHTADQVA